MSFWNEFFAGCTYALIALLVVGWVCLAIFIAVYLGSIWLPLGIFSAVVLFFVTVGFLIAVES